MDTIKNLIIYAVLIVLLWVAVVVIRRYAVRVQVPADYIEVQIPDVEHYPTYALSHLPFSAYSHGDAVAYRTPENSQHGTAFGWVLALPGDTVSISDGTLSVNGKPDIRFTSLGRPDLPPLPIPANFAFVVTSAHLTDSLVRGPLPAVAILGRLENFP
jgi:hypothetical protein